MGFRSVENYSLDGVYFLLGDGHLGPRVVMVSVLMLGGEIWIVNVWENLMRTQFVIARSAATWRSRSRGGVRCLDEIAALRSQ